MKNIFKYMAGALFAGFAMAACSPEDFEGAKGNIPQASEYADNFSITVDQATNYAYFEFKSAPGITPVWIIDGESYSSSFSFSKYYRKKGVYSVECKVKNADGISDGAIQKSFEIEKTMMNGFGGFVEDSEFNLFNGVTFGVASFYYAPGWAPIADPKYTQTGNSFTVTLPEATTDQWQAQMHLELTPAISLSADKKYDFSVILTSTASHPGVTVKLQDKSDDNSYLCADRVALEANEPKCFWFSGVDGIDASEIKFALDFGGNEANTEVTIESFVLKDHANDDGTEVPEVQETPFNYDDANNLWKAVDEEQSFKEIFWFGDSSWATITETAETTHNGSQHTITIPVETPNEEWHAQYKLNTELSAAGDTKIDFSLKASATLNGDAVKLPGMTVKLTELDNDNNFFFATRKAVSTEGVVFKQENATLAEGTDAANLQLVFDFGGAPEGTVITISEIVLVKK